MTTYQETVATFKLIRTIFRRVIFTGPSMPIIRDQVLYLLFIFFEITKQVNHRRGLTLQQRTIMTFEYTLLREQFQRSFQVLPNEPAVGEELIQIELNYT